MAHGGPGLVDLPELRIDSDYAQELFGVGELSGCEPLPLR
jgi:hypothetical protein